MRTGWHFYTVQNPMKADSSEQVQRHAGARSNDQEQEGGSKLRGRGEHGRKHKRGARAMLESGPARREK